MFTEVESMNISKCSQTLKLTLGWLLCDIENGISLRGARLNDVIHSGH